MFAKIRNAFTALVALLEIPRKCPHGDPECDRPGCIYCDDDNRVW